MTYEEAVESLQQGQPVSVRILPKTGGGPGTTVPAVKTVTELETLEAEHGREKLRFITITAGS